LKNEEEAPGNVAWRISSTSGGDQASCVEAGPYLDDTGRVAVRNSNDRQGPVVNYTQAEWTAFIAGVKRGEFDFNL
jgi:Domain of unknown function (DUF397)